MDRALGLAKRALGSASPNPAVGAVIVDDGVVVGEGWTQPRGQDHAEVMAIRQAGPMADGAILYTTLEPCNHQGKTPPCTDAIINAGISEVHAAMVDPNPLVNGSGLSRLSEAGIKTRVGVGEEAARQLNEAFTKFIATGQPFVTAKFAMSLDGKIATRTGDSRWITGQEARSYVHELRAESDAIMAGINTVLADDPRLTARNREGAPAARQPLRVIVDSSGRVPATASLLAEPGCTLVAVAEVDNTTKNRIARSGGEIVELPADGGSVDLPALVKFLGRREVTSVLVEGGGTLLGSLFDQGLVDKVIAFVAPIIVGGGTAPSPVAGAGIDVMADARRLHRVKVMEFGADVAIIGYCEE